MKNIISPSHLIDSDIGQLTKYFFELDINSDESLYVQIMMAYYLNDTMKLERLLKKSKSGSFFNVFITSRLATLKNTQYTIDDINKYNESPYIGDLYFAQALIAAHNNDHTKVKEFFFEAYNSYIKIGADKKALNARMNTITADGNIDVQKRLLANYIEAVEVLIEHNSITSAANTCVNIADEFHKIGAHRSAYRFNEKALELLKDQKNTLQYAQAMAHLCESLFCLGQNVNANKVLKELKSYKFIETVEATKVIENIHLKANNEINDRNLTTAWHIRLKKGSTPNLLGAVSDQLIHFLAHGPRSFESIINELYPNTDDLDAKNRLTTLISRINKNEEGLVIFNQLDQTFSLSNNEKIIFAQQDSIT